jgi:predicted phage replisome organizer
MTDIKICSNLFEQDKMRVIDSLKNGKIYIYVFLRLLCIAAKANVNGELKIFDNEFYTPEIMSNFFSLPLNLITESLEILQKYGLITVADNKYCVANFDEYALENKKERN